VELIATTGDGSAEAGVETFIGDGTDVEFIFKKGN